jgi:hypothetical protein
VLHAVSQAASSEYVHQLDIFCFSVRDIVKVLGVKVGRTLVSPARTEATSLHHTNILLGAVSQIKIHTIIYYLL